jgi:4-aminobutyrate aminotransferase-like enzyme
MAPHRHRPAAGVVCTNHTYHGNNIVVGALTNLPRPTPAIRTSARSPSRNAAPSCPRPQRRSAGARPTVARLKAAIADLKASGQGFAAALILCPILANEGLPDIPASFMGKAAALVRAEGGLIIADEVQAGYGRTGTWWGYDEVGLTPNIVVTGKPMGAGLPLAATCASREIVEQFRAEARYFNTFAASPLQGAVGLAVLDVIEEEGLVEHARTLGAELKAGLKQRLGSTPASSTCAAGACSSPPNSWMLMAIRTRPTPSPSSARSAAQASSPRSTAPSTIASRSPPPARPTRADALAFLDAFDRVCARA